MKRLTARLGVLAAMAMLAAAAPATAQGFSDGYNFLKSVRDRDVTKAKALIDKPGSTIINSRDSTSGETALMIAIKRRDAPWLAFLLQNGADPNMADKDGNTPLMVSAMNAFSDGVRLMLAGKARVDASNGRGETALIKAVQMKDAASVQLLLNAGADPDRTDSFAGMSARQYAERDVRNGPVAKLMAEAPKKEKKAIMGPRL
jgi:ankyrin repeat protein